MIAQWQAMGSRGVRVVQGLIAFILVSGWASAAQFTWDGGGSDTNWATGANWTGTPDNTTPGATDTALFASGGSTATLVADATIAGLTFNGGTGNFLITESGGARNLGLYSGGDITTSGANTYSIATTRLDLQGTSAGNKSVWDVGTGATLAMSASPNTPAGTQYIRKTGAGTLALSGVTTANEQYLFWEFDKGLVQLNRTASSLNISQASSLGNNTDVAGSAILRYMQNGQTSGRVPAIYASGVLDFNGFDSGGNLSMAGSGFVLEMRGGSILVPTGSGVGFAGDLASTTTEMRYVAGSGQAATVSGGGDFGLFNVSNAGLMRAIEVDDDPALDTELTFNTRIVAWVSSGVPGTSNQGIYKTGSGTLALNGANTYGGLTRVLAGRLLVNGSLDSQAAAGNVTVENSAATLGGSGQIIRNVSVTAGALAPGASAGSLEIGSGAVARNLAMSAGTMLAIELGGTAFTLNGTEEYDRLKVYGSTDITGASLHLSLINAFTPGDGDVFGILDAVGGLTGTFASLAEGDVVWSAGKTFLHITYQGLITDSTVATTGGADVVLYALQIPEPASAALLALAGLLGLRRRRG